MPDDEDSVAVPFASEVLEEIANPVGYVPQAFAFREWHIDAGRSLGVDVLHRCSSHRAVVVLAKAAVGMDRDTRAERDLGCLDGAPQVGAKDGGDLFYLSAFAKFARQRAAPVGEQRVTPAGGDA